MWRLGRSSASALVSALALTAAPAHAKPKADLGDVMDSGHRWFVAALGGAPAVDNGAVVSETTAARATTSPLPDTGPRAALLFRDWRGSVRLLGSQAVLVDRLRPTASNRMVLARLSVGHRVAPFVQGGAGQWRIDPAMFPSVRSPTRFAAQFGGGVEIRAIRGLDFAAEAQYTFVHDEEAASVDELPGVVSAVLALRATF